MQATIGRATIGQGVAAAEGTQQQRLAQQLIACLGRESALHVCRVNGWTGVLDEILQDAGIAAR